MMNSTGRNYKKHLIPALLTVSLMVLTSCNSREDVQKQEETVKNAPPPARAIEYTVNERSIKNNVYLNDENVGSLTEAKALEKLKGMAADMDKEAVNATISSKTWKVTKGTVGKKVNIDKTLELLLNTPEGKKISPVVEEVMPPVTSQKLLDNIVVIGNYTTTLLNRGESRVNNIDLAAEKIDYYKLSPGDEFSFNKVIGRRTEAKGYEDAPIIIKTEEGPKKSIAVGGGICQVSTTLYNALEECKVQILERHLHSKDVGYVPKGEDATVSYGSADFRFKNSRSHPIMIRTYLGKKYLTIRIVENRNL